MTNTPSTEPTRLLDDPTIDGLLRSDLELARTHSPLAYDASAGLARFEQTIASGGAAAASSAGVATTGRVLGWIVGAAVLVGGAGGATWVMSQADVDHRVVANVSPVTDEEVRSEDAAVAGATSSGRVAPLGARTTVAEDRLEPEAEDGGSPDAGEVGGNSRAVSSSTPPRPSSKSSEAAAAPAFASEAEAINAARKALASDPARALSLIEAAADEFPNGALVQEREGYAILALLGVGRRDEAEERAASYLERWPKGPLSRRVRDALAD